MNLQHMAKIVMIIFSSYKDRNAKDKWNDNNLRERLLVLI